MRTANWNADIVWKMRIELSLQWDIVEEEIGTVFGELLAAVRACLDVLMVAVATTSMPGELRAQLQAVVSARVERCEYSVTRAKEKFARDVK